MDDNFVPSGSTTTEKSLPRLQKHVQKFLYVSNLPYGLDERAYYDIFGYYGAIRQIRVGDTNERRGTAFVVYEDIYDAKRAYDELVGFQVSGRYLNVMYFNPKARQPKRLMRFLYPKSAST